MPRLVTHYSYKNSIKSDVSDELVNVYLQRPLAGIITCALFSTPVTPNQLTYISTLFGIAGGILLTLPEVQLQLAALCFYLKDIFDSADGQLARAKQLYSRRGRFLDSIGDFVVDLFLFGGIFVFLQRSGFSMLGSLLTCSAGLVGISLRVSYHVFYQTSFLHKKEQYQTNRITEELREEDFQQDATTLRLQKIFLFLYGWQDRLMLRLDAWCFGGSARPAEWYHDKTGLRLSGLLGFGTEFVVLTLCLLINNVPLYLFFTLVVFNSVWFATIFYRKHYLVKKCC